jgi:hypothetical protein
MKKILIGILILAATGGIFAQDAQEEGLKLTGDVKTGLRFVTDQYLEAEDGKMKAQNDDPTMTLWHDDAGGVRAQLHGLYSKDNYGVKFNLRWRKGDSAVEFYQAYVWADFFNKMLNLKAGNLDDSAWSSGGDEGFHFSTGYGVRFEIKPIEGLNLGFILKNTDGDYQATGKEATTSGFEATAAYFLLETSFGVKYEHSMFDVAAGFRLDGKGDTLATKDWYGDYKGGFKTRNAPKKTVPIFEPDQTITIPGTTTTIPGTPTTIPIPGTTILIPGKQIGTEWDGEREDWDKGMRAYIGGKIKAVQNLGINVEAQFNNLNGFADYGWIWINEKVQYSMSPSTVGLAMHQFLFGADNTFIPYLVDDNGELKSVPVRLQFKPYVSYGLNDKLTLGFELPINIWPDVVTFEIGAKPKITYKLGSNASISAYYFFNYLQFSKELFGGEAPDGLIKNAIQVNFEWSF